MKSRNSGIILSYLYNFLHMAVGLFMSSFLLRRFGDIDYGIYQTISSFINYLVILEFGTGTVMTRNISLCRSRGASKQEIEKNISTIWTITAILSLIISLVAIVFYFSIDSVYASSMTVEQIAYGKRIFIVIAVYLLISFVSQTLRGAILGFEIYTFSTKLSLVRLILRTVLIVSLSFAFEQAIIIAIVDAGLSFITGVIIYIYFKKKTGMSISFRYFDKKIFKSILPLCLALLLQSIVQQANNNVDKFIIGIKLTPQMVSLYSIPMYIYTIFSSLSSIPISLYSPQTAKVITSSNMDSKAITNFLIRPSRLISLISGTILFGFIAIGKPFINIVYGESYHLAWGIAVIVMIPTFINMTTAPIINVLDVLNKRMTRSVALIFTTVLNIILTIIWIDDFGVVGAAMATALCTLLGQVLIMNIYYIKNLKINIFDVYFKSYKGVLIYQLLGCVVGYFVAEQIKSDIVSFLAGGIIYVIISFGGFLLFGKNEDEKKKIKGIFNKVKRVFGK